MFKQPVPPVPIPATTWAAASGDSPARGMGPGSSDLAVRAALVHSRQEKGPYLGVQVLQGRCSPEEQPPTARSGSGGVVAPPRAWGQQGRGGLCLTSVPSLTLLPQFLPRAMMSGTGTAPRVFLDTQIKVISTQVSLMLPINSE